MRRIIITGACGGIGGATARRFADDLGAGCSLVLTDVDDAALQSLAATLRSRGAAVETVAGDLTDADLPGRVVDRSLEAFGGLDTLVSNAGTTRRGPLATQTEANWDHVMDVNVRSFWRLAKAGHDALASSRGIVVAVASIAATAPNPGTGFYSASKAALLSLVQQLGLEWAPDGIRVNAVSPGVTLTQLNSRQYDDVSLKERREALIPLRRFARPEDIAGAIAFLAGPGASFCQGYNLVVDGGLTPSVLAHSLPPVGSRRPA